MYFHRLISFVMQLISAKKTFAKKEMATVTMIASAAGPSSVGPTTAARPCPLDMFMMMTAAVLKIQISAGFLRLGISL